MSQDHFYGILCKIENHIQNQNSTFREAMSSLMEKTYGVPGDKRILQTEE